MPYTKKEQKQQIKNSKYQQNFVPVSRKNSSLMPLMKCSPYSQHIAVLFLLLLAGGYVAAQLREDEQHGSALIDKSGFAPVANSYQPTFFTMQTATTLPSLEGAIPTVTTWSQHVISITNSTCQRIKQNKFLNALNNPVYFTYVQRKGHIVAQWAESPEKSATLRQEIYSQAREIMLSLLEQSTSALWQEMNAKSHYFAKLINQDLDRSGLRGERREQIFNTLATAMLEYGNLLIALMNTQINTAFVKLMEGGHCGELAQLTARELVREFDRNGKGRMPSIALTSMGGKDRNYAHELVKIYHKQPDTGTTRGYYCDTWLHKEQEGPFMIGLDRHLLMQHTPLYQHSYQEIGITPDLTKHPEVIQKFFSSHRKKLVYSEYNIPEKQSLELMALRDKLQAALIEEDAFFGSMDSMHLIQDHNRP